VSKPVLGLVLGGVLGVLDGLSALISAPNDPAVKAGIVGIVIGSTGKGLITGALIGWFARRSASLQNTLLFGLAVGLALAFCVSLAQMRAGQPPYYWQIMLPGGILGLIVGYATFKAPASTPAPAMQRR
jgi:xanthosine utilization system XapX-like protein